VLGNEHAVGYGYDVSGRLATISAQGLPNLPGKTHAFEYTYEPGSSLIDKVTGPVHEVDNTYEANRNVLNEKKNIRTVGTPGELSVIGYTVNKIGQREQRNLSGLIRSEFYGGQAEDLYPTGWTYDAIGQVTSEDKPDTASDRGYSYDLIGNRLTSTADTVTTTYSSNALNQYQEISVPSVQSVVPIHDQDGNMTTGLLNGSGNGQFEYDGANQLIRTQATATSDPTRYAYDAFGRRIAKVTYPNGSAVAS
jgi:YD repeat-containing protein